MSCVGGWASDSAAHMEVLSEKADLVTALYGRGSAESERAIKTYVMALHKLTSARKAFEDRVWEDQLRAERQRQRDELQILIDRANGRQLAAA